MAAKAKAKSKPAGALEVQSRPEPYDLLFKVVTIGDSGSGKTSLIHRFVHGAPLEDQRSTLGVEFSAKNLVKEDGKTLRVQFWDTAGNDRYAALTSSYFRGAVAACVVYDIASFASFKNCLLYTSPSPRDLSTSRMPSSA